MEDGSISHSGRFGDDQALGQVKGDRRIVVTTLDHNNDLGRPEGVDQFIPRCKDP